MKDKMKDNMKDNSVSNNEQNDLGLGNKLNLNNFKLSNPIVTTLIIILVISLILGGITIFKKIGINK